MENKIRKKLLKLYVSEKEYELIQYKMKLSNFKSFSQYARKMLIDGFIVDITSCNKLQKLIYEINKIGVNLNQLTRISNEIKFIGKSTLHELTKIYEQLEELVKRKVVKILGYNKNETSVYNPKSVVELYKRHRENID